MDMGSAHSELVGPALNEAVRLEKIANYPRVIFDAACTSHLRNATGETAHAFRAALMASTDGFLQVRPALEIKAGTRVLCTVDEAIAIGKKVIAETLIEMKHVRKIKAKLIWLRKTLVACRTTGTFDFDQFETDVYPLIVRR